jgi:hypothetical protein
VDFGRGEPHIGADGRRKTSWVFRIVLSHSRKEYSESVAHQTIDEFLRCLENAFAHFGGLPVPQHNYRYAYQFVRWNGYLCDKGAGDISCYESTGSFHDCSIPRP